MVNKDKFCLDPIGRHKKIIYTSLKAVTEKLSALVEGKIKVNSLMCSNCCNYIRKNTEFYINELSRLSQEVSDNESATSTHASSTDIDMSAVNADYILSLSGVSPIKKSKKLSFILYLFDYICK